MFEDIDRKLEEATRRRNERIASWAEIKALIKDSTPDGLASIDQLHTGGLFATRQLAHLARIAKGERVLDVGCGIGGPARVLAHECGASVTGVDIAAGLIELAQRLGEVAGIPVTFQQADALNLPFEDGSFDVVWTQHAASTIADKTRFYGELRRVLRPGGRMAMHDLMGGTAAGPLHMPIPCADSEDVTFLAEPGELRTLLQTLNLHELLWSDCTQATISFFEKLPPTAPFSIRLIKGDRFPEMVTNLKRNLQEGRTTVVMAVLEAS